MALKLHPEEFGSTPQGNFSFNQKPYEVYSNELDIVDKTFKFGAKQWNNYLEFNGKAKFSNEKLYARLQGSTNNNPKLLDIKGVFRTQFPRKMDFKVDFKQSKIVEISFKEDFEHSKYRGFFQMKANRESQVDIKLENYKNEVKFAMTSKIPNFEKVEMALKVEPTIKVCIITFQIIFPKWQ